MSNNPKLLVVVQVEHNLRRYEFILRNDYKGGMTSHPLNEATADQRSIIHVMNATATDLKQDADQHLPPDLAAQVKTLIDAVAATKTLVLSACNRSKGDDAVVIVDPKQTIRNGYLAASTPKQRQQRQNIRNGYLTASVDEIRRGMEQQDDFGRAVLQEMLDECARYGVDNYGKTPA